MVNKKKLHQYVGSTQQVGGVRRVLCMEGRSAALELFDVTNGPMHFQAMCGKCLDISSLSYRGINMSFLSKPGLQGRNHYDTNGQEALRSIMGGLFFTAGLENICAPHENESGSFPMHGRMRTTPAENLYSQEEWTDRGLVYTIGGTMREAELFGENLVLRRRIETVLGQKTITLTDEIENESFRREPMMLLYHINLGYPFLSPNLKLYIPTRSVTPRDEASEGHEEQYDRMDLPKDNEPEYVFLHDIEQEEDGTACVLAVNEKLGLGLRLEYTTKYLPYFMEWKSIASGDYVIGLEPSNSSVYGRGYHEAQGNLHHLEPFEKERNQLKFTILDGEEKIACAVRRFQEKHPNPRTHG